MRRALALFVVATVAACASRPEMVWVRTDGRRPSLDVALRHQFETDRLVCVGEGGRASLAGATPTGEGWLSSAAREHRRDAEDNVIRGCMAQRGYVLVSETEAAAKRDEFAAAARPQTGPQARR